MNLEKLKKIIIQLGDKINSQLLFVSLYYFSVLLGPDEYK